MLDRRLAAAAAAVSCLAAPITVAGARDFERPSSGDTAQVFSYGSAQRQDTPTDPDYDQSEPDAANGRSSSNLYDERFDLFGFPSQLTPAAVYREGPHQGSLMVSGFNAAGAWKAQRGRADVAVAILDTGIKWDKTSLRRQVRLNTAELPYPQHDRTASPEPGLDCSKYASDTYDANGDGAVDVADYACDSRVSLSYPGRTGPRNLITGQDLLQAFGSCQIAEHRLVRCVAGQHFDNDHNGYANDIVGWNFFDNTNDPTDRSSYFAASNHGSGRAENAVERGNDGSGSIGVCPHCQFVPMRVWDTFVSDANTFGLAITYATDNGIRVIEGADGALYHSAFAERASQYAYDHGVVQAFSGDDLNTGNHNYPANYSHAMLIQGTVPDTVGLGSNASNEITAFFKLPLASNAPPQTYFRGANTTQYGGKSSLSMEGSTGSENTGKAAGAAALVISAAADRSITLSADETRAILEQTAERVTSANTQGTGVPDPGADAGVPPDQQWTSHFGWGRVDLGRAVSVAASGRIPPEAAIDSPDWFAPLTGANLPVTGLARARFAAGGAFHYRLMWGVGETPTTWNTVREGDAQGSLSELGTIDLDQVRRALSSYQAPLDTGGPVFSPTAPNPFGREFTVQLEVTSPELPTPGIDRRVFTALADPTLRAGFPRRMGTGGEAPLRYADLNGDGIQELVLPTEDGLVHAFERDGSELAGWPVHTLTQAAAAGHSGAPALRSMPPPLEPSRGPVIIDLAGDGKPNVVISAGTHLYAWDAAGRPRRGFPASSNLAFCRPEDESQKPQHRRKCGFAAAPSAAHLEGYTRPVDIVAPSLDGHLYAFRADGSPVPGYPVTLVDPGVPAAQQVLSESINEAAVGPLTGAAHDDLVVADNETYGSDQGSGDVNGGFAQGLANVLSQAAGGSTRVYAIDGPTGHLLPGWPIKINGAIQTTLPFVGPGHDPSIVRLGGQPTVVASATGGALSEYGVDGHLIRSAQQATNGPQSNATDRSGTLNLFESASIGDLLGSGTPALVKYGVSLGQVANLLLTGQNLPYNHLIGAYDATTGNPLSAFPTITDDYQFLSASNVAKIDPGSRSNQVLAGTGLGLLHAYDGATGQDVAGYPKQTGGWLFAPAALSDDGRVADITREGYLFEWADSHPACQSEWPSYRHDQQGSGDYNHDGTPPGAPRQLKLTPRGGGRYTLSFIAPGDDDFCGTAATFLTRVNGRAVDLGLGAPPPAGTRVARPVTLPAGARVLAVSARDRAGNIGVPATARLAGGSGRACLASRPRVTRSAIAGVRLGDRAARILRRLGRPYVHRAGVLRYCVRGGGRVFVALSHGRAALVASSAATAGPHPLARRAALSRIRHAYPSARLRRPQLLIAGASRPILLAVSHRRLRYLFIARPSLTRSLPRSARVVDAVLHRLHLGGV